MKKKSWVKAGNEWIDLNKKGVQFEDISEDPFGRDLVTFKYKGQQFQSFVLIGYSAPK